MYAKFPSVSRRIREFYDISIGDLNELISMSDRGSTAEEINAYMLNRPVSGGITMWTPPPTTEIDLVRTEIAAYHKEEIIQAWYSQTDDGQPWNIMLFFTQYQSIEEYLAENSPAEIAKQIDWWTGTRMYNAGTYLGERHYEDREYCYDYYKEEAEKHGECPPNHDDERFLACNPDQGTDEWFCAYEPEPSEMAEELDNQDRKLGPRPGR